MIEHYIIDISEANIIIDQLMAYCQFGIRYEFDVPCPPSCPALKYCNFKKEIEGGDAIHGSGETGT